MLGGIAPHYRKMEEGGSVSRRVCFGMLVGVILIILSGGAQGTTTIMPLGDSITAGTGSLSTGGYRLQLYDLLSAGGYSFDFVGSQSSGSLPDPNHEGHVGAYAEDILANVTGWLSLNPANIILLHIGTNDINHGEAPASVVADVNGILGDIYQASPSSNVILAEIINFQTYNPNITAYNSLVGALSTTWSSKPGFLTIVDMENALDYTTDMDDLLHPNLSGYDKMAAVWYPALASVIDSSVGVPEPTSLYTPRA